MPFIPKHSGMGQEPSSPLCVFIVYTVCVIYVSFVSLLVSVKAHSLLSLSSAVLLSFACSFYLSRTRSKTRTLSKALVLVHRTRCNCSPFCWTQKALFNIYYVAQRTIYHKEVAMDLLNSFFFFWRYSSSLDRLLSPITANDSVTLRGACECAASFIQRQQASPLTLSLTHRKLL